MYASWKSGNRWGSGKFLGGGVILHGCGGDKSEVERYYGMSFEEAIQNGMDSKIVDLDYLMVFYVEEYDKGKVDEEWERY